MNSPQLIAGVDEVGRGPLAGAVVAAAVILDSNAPISGLMDSKALTESKRQQLATQIYQHALAYAFGRAEVNEIDEINILQASLLAMQRAVSQLNIAPTQVLVDGKFCPNVNYPVEAIIKGDQKVSEISAASIIAKVTRDQEMVELDKIYPGYGFAKHKGYPTKAHLQAIQILGICDIHRRSFKPIKQYL